MRIGLVHDGVIALTWEVGASAVRIGRAAANDLVVPHLDVSGHHAVLHSADGQVWVTDLRSANGTFVDDARIVGPTALAVGGQVRLGAHAVFVVLGQDAAEPSLLLERDDGLAAWPIPRAGLLIPGTDAALDLDEGIPWLTTPHADDRRVVLGEVFDLGGVRYRVRAADIAPTTERLPTPTILELDVDLPGGRAVLTGPDGRCVFAADHRVALLHALGARWLADGGDGEAGWLDDEDLAVAVWGRRHRDQGANNLHVLVHRVRGEAVAAGLERGFVQKRAGRTRLRVGRVAVR